MSSLSRPRRSPKREFTCARIDDRTIEVNGHHYQVEAIGAGEFGTAAYRLCKHGSDKVYDVIRDHDNLVRCDCPSYVTTHDGTISTCKHGRALVALGLLDPPGLVPTPETATEETATAWDLEPAILEVWGIDDQVGPEPEPALVPGLPLDELASAQASWFRSWGNDAGDLFAETFDLLAAEIRSLTTPGRPITPEIFRDRRDALADLHSEY